MERMERATQFISAILAGCMIGIGGTVYLLQKNTIIGSFLFAVGLFTIVCFQLHLYTGKIGYLPFQKPIYVLELFVTWIGNFIGTFLAAFMVQNTRLYDTIIQNVQTIVSVKLSDDIMSIFLLSIFCGLLMFIAVDVFRNQTGSTIRIIAIFIPVMVFILSGFEHVIANMYYISLSNAWNGHSFLYILVMTVGNSIGGMLLPLYLKLFRLRT